MDQLPSSELSIEEMLLAKEKSSLISIAMEQLSVTERLLLEGKYILEYSDDELAKQLNCKSGSIRMKLTRARRHALSILSQMNWKGESDDDQQARSIAGKV